MYSKVRNFGTKAKWLLKIAQTTQKDENIRLTMEGLVSLKGIGRWSANVTIREAKVPAVSITTDLNVIRVAPRIGIIKETKDEIRAKKIVDTSVTKRILRIN